MGVGIMRDYTLEQEDLKRLAHTVVFALVMNSLVQSLLQFTTACGVHDWSKQDFSGAVSGFSVN